MLYHLLTTPEAIMAHLEMARFFLRHMTIPSLLGGTLGSLLVALFDSVVFNSVPWR
jgi:hypothetical protein